jgi:hypothetical protein
VYSTCTFCHASLGKNEALERFPVGSRLAFDQAQGRLWVVCPSCRQWNLSPLEERWEAIEQAEKLYRDTRLRASTDNIGLARLRDGTDLIRIGEALRPEMAAWRYGARLRSRRVRYLVLGTGAAALLGYGIVAPWMGLALAGGGVLPYQALEFLERRYRSSKIFARGEDQRGTFVITRAQADFARVVFAPSTPEGWRLQLQRLRLDLPVGAWAPLFASAPDGESVVTGDAAVKLARVVLPQVNRSGASDRRVAEATSLLEAGESVHELFRARASRTIVSDPSSLLAQAPAALRLAMEMALHEEAERRALDGELVQLEAQWREAEEVAAIADSLALPQRIVDRVNRLRGA